MYLSNLVNYAKPSNYYACAKICPTFSTVHYWKRLVGAGVLMVFELTTKLAVCLVNSLSKLYAFGESSVYILHIISYCKPSMKISSLSQSDVASI